ncbi:MAG: right-handed parallel beta-helix repeat-containing protein, partial [Thermoplasmata archaeon]|nr:right-handed parallel beta-helix repeat-containing protein [Thermoplasmata archaeon]
MRELPAIVLCLLALSVATATQVAADFVIVDDDWAEADHSTVQAAIDDAGTMDGDIIYVYAGVYNEDVIVNKTVTIWGNGSGVTRILGSAVCLNVSANATLKRLSVENADFGIFSTAANVRFTRIGAVNIDQDPIEVHGATSCFISRFTADDGERAIDVRDSTNVTIENASISGIVIAGIYTTDVRDLSIRDVSIEGGTYGIDLGSVTSYAEVEDVTVTGAHFGIMLKDVDNSSVSGAVVVDCVEGFDIAVVERVELDGCQVLGAGIAMSISDAVDLDIIGSTVRWSDVHHIDARESTVRIVGSTFSSCNGSAPSMDFEASDVFMDLCSVMGSSIGLGLDAATATMINSTVECGSDIDLAAASTADTLNCTYDTVNTDGTGLLTAMNHLHVQVDNEMGPIEGAEVLVTDGASYVYATPTFGGDDQRTAQDGGIEWIVVTSFTIDDGVYARNDTNVTVMLGPWTRTRELNMSASHTESFLRPMRVEIYVDDDASMPMNGSIDRPYDTVQRAVDNSTGGDVIHVRPGEYPYVLVDRVVTIRGTALAKVDWMTVASDGVDLDDMRFRALEVRSACTATDLAVEGGGIEVRSAGEMSIVNATVDGWLSVAGTLTWEDGAIWNSTGIALSDSGHATLMNVTLRGGGAWAEGTLVWLGGAMEDAPNGIGVQGSVVLEGLAIEGSGNPIVGHSGAYVTISDVTVANCTGPISFTDVAGLSLSDVRTDGTID